MNRLLITLCACLYGCPTSLPDLPETVDAGFVRADAMFDGGIVRPDATHPIDGGVQLDGGVLDTGSDEDLGIPDAELSMDAGEARDAGVAPDADLPPDAALADAEPRDAGVSDAETFPDATVADAGVRDSGPVDTGVRSDAGPSDSGLVPDAGLAMDAGIALDAGFPDSGVVPDAGVPDSGVVLPPLGSDVMGLRVIGGSPRGCIDLQTAFPSCPACWSQGGWFIFYDFNNDVWNANGQVSWLSAVQIEGDLCFDLGFLAGAPNNSELGGVPISRVGHDGSFIQPAHPANNRRDEALDTELCGPPGGSPTYPESEPLCLFHPNTGTPDPTDGHYTFVVCKTASGVVAGPCP